MDDEYLSDLTDVEEDEVNDTLSPSKRTRTRAKGDNSTYRIQGALNAPRATTYNAQHIFGEWRRVVRRCVELRRYRPAGGGRY